MHLLTRKANANDKHEPEDLDKNNCRLFPCELCHVSVCLSHSEHMSDHELNLNVLLTDLLGEDDDGALLPTEQIDAF